MIPPAASVAVAATATRSSSFSTPPHAMELEPNRPNDFSQGIPQPSGVPKLHLMRLAHFQKPATQYAPEPGRRPDCASSLVRCRLMARLKRLHSTGRLADCQPKSAELSDVCST